MNLPARYAQQGAGQQQRGPYLQITCACRTDHAWLVPFLPGRQSYNCPVCFGITRIEICSDGKMFTWGEETRMTEEVDRLRLQGLQFAHMPDMPLPGLPGSLEDFINQL